MDERIDITGLYENWFLEYASYVIMERALPTMLDGLKPVQRRILHAMYKMDDGRFHKVANIIGQTMQYHPHGDAAIGDAIVHLGQKNLLIEPQGNWGDIRTGDRAAASRYIEARLSKFALDIAFNPKTTAFQLSYDGRNKEPVNLPVKFPLALAQGIEGIAVGLSTKIMPHNFIELIDASIESLKGNGTNIFPDFPNGGTADFSHYNSGKKGGKIRVRADIKTRDRHKLVMHEIPYGTTTRALIESIVKANENGKIKIKKVTDNTAENVEIIVDLPSGVSADVTRDALYAFTDCETSISPNCCVIIDDKPRFLSVDELLKLSTENTLNLLRRELEIKLRETEEKWHFASIEKIFIEKRVYREMEECDSWEMVLKCVGKGLRAYQKSLKRDITEQDIVRLTEIKIKRISKYDALKTGKTICALEDEMAQTRHNLNHLSQYAIEYFQALKEKYGKGRERKTKIGVFETIQPTQVAIANQKLYVNRKEGFVGYSLKKDEFVCECSDIDDIVVFLKNGRFQVTRISNKSFVGKDIIHVGVWKKNDKRTVYNMIYQDGASGNSFVKRFSITAVTRDNEYDLTKGNKGSKILYFTANPNGETEVVTVKLQPKCRARNKVFDFAFADIAVKGRGSQGNQLSKYPVSRVVQKQAGAWSFKNIKLWYEKSTGQINNNERGVYLGSFDNGDLLLSIEKNGICRLLNLDLTSYDPENVLILEKYSSKTTITAVHYDGEKKYHFVKRFNIEAASAGKEFKFISDHKNSRLEFVSTKARPHIELKYEKKRPRRQVRDIIDLCEFIDVKGWKAKGNRLCFFEVLSIIPAEVPEKEAEPAGELAVEKQAKNQAPDRQAENSLVQDSFFDVDFWD